MLKKRKAQTPRKKPLELRITNPDERVVTFQASNDLEPDSYGTVITVESLTDWAEGFMQHRTVSQQHGETSFGIEGRPQVGIATEIRFEPQLMIDFRVDDLDTWQLIQDGKITGGSLEFLPTESRFEGDIEYFLRLSNEPEMCGVTVTNAPSVPNANITKRMTAPNWSYAVIDPAVINGQITDPEKIRALRWFDHHDHVSHLSDDDMLARAYEDVQSERFDVPEFATLTREQIKSLALAHLARHTRPATRSKEGKPTMNKWIQTRAAQYVLEGRTQAAAELQAKADYKALSPETRSTIEAAQDAPETIEASATTAPDEEEATQTAAVEAGAATQTAAVDEPVATRSVTDEQLNTIIAKRVKEELGRQTENTVALPAGFARPKVRMQNEQLLNAIMYRTVLAQAAGIQVTPHMRNEVDNMLREHGIEIRALSVEGNATVLYTDLATMFAVKPSSSTIGRTHFRTVPMAGVSGRNMPKMDGSSMTFEWNRHSVDDALGGNADPTNGVYDLDMAELSGSTPPIADNFLRWNAAGQRYLSEYLLPELRKQAQIAEDKAIFLSTGAAPYPTEFRGLLTATGVTAVTSSTNGDAFTLNILTSLERAMPAKFDVNKDQYAFYLERQIGYDYGDLLGNRATNMGDRVLERFSGVSGPMPIGIHHDIPVFSVPWLPKNETQGSSSVASTAFLADRSQVVIGDEMSIRIEPYRLPNFKTVLQLAENVGVGYQFADGIVRRAGVLAAA